MQTDAKELLSLEWRNYEFNLERCRSTRTHLWRKPHHGRVDHSIPVHTDAHNSREQTTMKALQTGVEQNQTLTRWRET